MSNETKKIDPGSEPKTVSLKHPLKYTIIRNHCRVNYDDVCSALPEECLKEFLEFSADKKRQFQDEFYKALTPVQRERVDKYFPRAIVWGFLQNDCPYTATGYYWPGPVSHLIWFLYKVLCPTKSQTITKEIRSGLWYFFDCLFDFDTPKFPPARDISVTAKYRFEKKVFFD